MWPTCINNLSPLKGKFSVEIPELLKTAFNEKGIFNEDEMFMPIRIVKILGHCNTAMYFDCPNIPEHHVNNALLYEAENFIRYLEEIGRYYWFDFDIVEMDGVWLPLRMVFNDGNADTNDGFWGAVWERNTEEIIANIISSGDMETTVEAISKKHIDMYESQETLIPTIFDNTGWISDNIIVANDTKIEKIIRFAIQFFYEWKSYYKEYKDDISLIDEEEEITDLIVIDDIIDDEDELED